MEKNDPWSSNDGDLCDGSQIDFKSRCCANDDHYKCPTNECRDHQSGKIAKKINNFWLTSSENNIVLPNLYTLKMI